VSLIVCFPPDIEVVEIDVGAGRTAAGELVVPAYLKEEAELFEAPGDFVPVGDEVVADVEAEGDPFALDGLGIAEEDELCVADLKGRLRRAGEDVAQLHVVRDVREVVGRDGDDDELHVLALGAALPVFDSVEALDALGQLVQLEVLYEVVDAVALGRCGVVHAQDGGVLAGVGAVGRDLEAGFIYEGDPGIGAVFEAGVLQVVRAGVGRPAAVAVVGAGGRE
jgi:hypothetical protein